MSSIVSQTILAGVYLLDVERERERLKLQAEVWTPATERLLDAVGVRAGWHCIDLGCGSPGALRSLARRVGWSGRVVGLDSDPRLIADAEAWARQERVSQLQLIEGDAFATGLPSAAFDLVHVRFMFAPLGRAAQLFDEVHRLVRPGGIVVIQEPDAAAWRCAPPSVHFARLVDAIVGTFESSGGNFNAGRDSHALLRERGYQAIGVRGEVLTLPGGHPYARLPLLFAESLDAKLAARLGRDAFERVKAGCDAACSDPGSLITSFVVQQAWGRRPG